MSTDYHNLATASPAPKSYCVVYITARGKRVFAPFRSTEFDKAIGLAQFATNRNPMTQPVVKDNFDNEYNY